MRLLAGVPRSGKTTLAGLGSWHTDDLGLDRARFEARVDEVAGWIRSRSAGVIEGVLVVHALRRLLREGCDLSGVSVGFLDTPHGELSLGQASMASGCRTIWLEIEPLLRAAGVKVCHGGF